MAQETIFKILLGGNTQLMNNCKILSLINSSNSILPITTKKQSKTSSKHLKTE